MVEIVIDEEFSSIVPPLKNEEYDYLEESIVRDGCRDALIVWHETQILLDGHNRYYICKNHGLDFRTTELSFPDRDTAKEWLVKNQLGRRNITPFQAYELTTHLKPAIEMRAKAREIAGTYFGANPYRLGQINPGANLPEGSEVGRVREILAKKAGISGRTWDKCEYIEERADGDLKSKLRAGGESIDGAFNVLKYEERAKEYAEKIEKIVDVPLPKNKYRCIVVDPPWPVTKIEREVRPSQTGYDYPGMTIDEIRSFPIDEITNEDCHIYLWTTQKYLPIAFEILDDWGFHYIFTMVWRKGNGFQPFGLPQYNCEFVLFGRRGGLPFLDLKDFSTCFDGRRREHSRKPEEFYNTVRRVSPGPRIDVFSREKRDGFDQYGNEVDRFGDE